ncbi:MAG TPA: helix-turn-helix transcriptional regulator [Ruminiclostridium sp.]|nr:helix-turn-helix transcriptional regulator [Ruminiclostridium sp.]
MNGAGNRIKELRKENNLTQAQFGAKIGLKDSAVSMLERNERNLTDTVVNNIVSQFCINRNWLRTGTGNKYNRKLLDLRNFLDANFGLSQVLFNKQLEILNKLRLMNGAERKSMEDLLTSIYIEILNPEFKANSNCIGYLSDDEPIILRLYRGLDPKSKAEVLSFIEFKIHCQSSNDMAKGG